MNKVENIIELPFPALGKVLLNLDLADKMRLAQTCTSFYGLLSWRRGSEDIEALAGKKITLERGVSDVYFATALFWGIKEGLTPAEIAEKLGQKAFKAAYEARHPSPDEISAESTLLHGAQSAAEVNFLLKTGIDVDAPDSWNQTPLFQVISRAGEPEGMNLEVFYRLLSVGADVNVEESEYQVTPLGCAISARAPLEVIQALVTKRANPSAKLFGQPIIEYAQKHYPEAVPLLIGERNRE